MANDPDFKSDYSLWFTEDGDEAARRLINLSDEGHENNKPRRDLAAYNASVLEGVGLKGFGAWAYGAKSNGPATVAYDGKDRCPIVWNYAAAGLDTLQGKIAGRDEAKPMVQVTDGDWDDHRRAVWSGRLLDGLYSEDHGLYHDVWDLGRQAFKITAGVTGTVAAKVVGYPGEDRLICELHDTLDMFIDHFECSYSTPLTYGEDTWFDPLRLIACFDDRKTKQLIWDAKEPLPVERGGGVNERTRYMVRAVEGWRCKLGKEPGKYLLATRLGHLLQKPYNYGTPPFAFLHGRRSLAGFYGIPIMERGMRIVERINQILHTVDKAERLVPRSMAIFDVKATPKELIKVVRDVMQLGYSSESGGHIPQYITPDIYADTVMKLLEAHIRAFHETLGINANEMGGTKAQGVVAAVAIRTVADLMTELFSVISRDYTKWITAGIGGLFLREVSDKPGLVANWKGNGAMRSVKASMADMKGKKFVFGIQPVSETRNTPADRISMADEMLARGELSEEAHARVIATGDLPAETKVQQTQIQMIAQAIDSWMHDEMDEITNISPLPWMNLAGAIVQCLDAYMAVLMMPKFDTAREMYFRRYITQCDAQMKKQALEKAKLEAVAGGRGGAAPAAAPAEQPIAAE